MSEDRQLPHNFEAEQGLIGAVIIKNDLIFELMHVVRAEDFFEPTNGDLWRLLLDQISNNRAVTRLTMLQDVAQESTIADGMKTREYIARIVEGAEPVLARDYARIVRDNSEKRDLINFGRELVEATFNCPPSVPSGELRAENDSKFGTLYRTQADLGIQHIADVGDMVIDRVEVAIHGHAEIGLASGLKTVTDLIGPLFPGDLVPLGGAPGSGKTALAQQICQYIGRKPESGKPKIALLYSIEMRRDQLAARMLAASAEVTVRSIRSGQMDREAQERLVEANAANRGTGFYVVHAKYPTINDVRMTALRMMRTVGLDFMALDHLHYLAPPKPGMEENEAINLNLMGLKQLADDLGIPIMPLVQFTAAGLRDMHKWPHRRPSIGDILYTGAVERHADAVALIHRPMYFLKRNEPDKTEKHYAEWETRKLKEEEGLVDLKADSWADIIIGKAREGEGYGSRRCYFDGKRVRFFDHGPPKPSPISARDAEELFALQPG